MKKTALVTGASRGIGYEIAVSLAKKGHQVVATARSHNLLENLQQAYADTISVFPADLTDADDIEQLGNCISSKFTGLDILVNNAGALVNKPFKELSKTDWNRMLDINLLAPVALVKALLNHFSDKAHIINISSMGGFQGSSKFPGLSAYSVSKGALSTLSECLAAELADQGIRSNALCLGAVQTEMLAEAFPGFEAPVSPEQMGQHIAEFALEGAAVYNGQVLPVALGNAP